MVFAGKSTGMTRKKRCHARNRLVMILSANINHFPPMIQILPLQESLRRALPTVLGCKDYREEEQLLERVDRLLEASGIERLFLGLSLERFEQEAAKRRERADKVQDGSKARERFLLKSREALRCTVLVNLVGGSYRQMSKALAMSPLYRWFCRCEDFEVVRVPGKSALQDYVHWLPAAKMEQLLGALAAAVADEDRAREIGLEGELDAAVVWVDTTCLKANIHFPTDWVLLRDAVGTLVASILTIRRHGLRQRIPPPEEFLRQINALAMSMAAAGRRKPGAKKERKRLLRAMKKVVGVVGRHAQRYREALDRRWEQTDLTRKEAEVILRRMDRVIGQLPAARRQAHERIIGERQVPNAEKILSLHETDIHVVVRGKAGAEVEFGNSLFVAETSEGFIVDHELRREGSPGDAKWLMERYARIREASGGRLCAVVADRGFDSAASRRLLASQEAFNGICPRDPGELSRRMQTDEVFAAATGRRAQTEGRIGILKNRFLDGGVPKAKGFANRQLQVAWAVLAHNLWVVARRLWRESSGQEAVAA